MTRQILIAALIPLFLLAPAAAAQNATGAPAIAPRDDATNTASLSRVVPNTNYSSGMTTGGGNVADADGITANADSWTRSWQTSADGGSSWTTEVGKGRRYTPMAADETAGHLRVCVFFSDSAGNAEGGSPSSTAAQRLSNATLCSAAAAVSANQAPTGAITIQARGDSSATASLRLVSVGARYDVGETTGGGTLADPNGNPTTIRKSWQRSSDGTSWTEAATFVTGSSANSYTVAEADRMAGHLRACVFFNDGGGYAEGGDASSAATRASSATICAPAITTFNDAAVAGAITAADGTDLSTTGPSEGSPLTAAAPTDVQGLTNAAFSWQWAQADDPDSATPADIAGATSATFTPMQEQVGKYLHVCASFTDDAGNAERACADLDHAVRNLNADPSGRIAINTASNPGNRALSTLRDGIAYSMGYTTGGGTIMDADGDGLQPSRAGEGAFGSPGEGISWQTAAAPDGPWTEAAFGSDRDRAVMEFTPQPAHVGGYVRVCVFYFDGQGTLEGGDSESPATRAAATSTNTCSIAALVANLGDISEEQVQQLSAVLSVAAATNAADAISGALSGPLAADASGFDMALGGTSLAGIYRSLHSGPAAIATGDQRAWFLGTGDSWEYQAAYNANDNSAASLARRLSAMADGNLAMQYGPGGAAGTRYWARFQQLDISGNPTQDDGSILEYDGDSTGFYVGADRMVGESMRMGLAIGMDSADMAVTLDEGDDAQDEASRSATSIYPYLRMHLGGGNEARLMAGFGSGDLDITSSQSGTASAGLSWMMLAGNLSHSRQLGSSLRTRFSGSLQYSDSSTDEAAFSDAPAIRVQASSAASGELAFNAELGYGSGSLRPFVNATARKWFGDLSQSLAYDLGAGADISSGAYSLRLATTRQINDTTHERHSLSIDLGINPSARGLSATFGNRWDSLSGRPQWTGTLSWRRGTFQASLQAAQADLRLHGKLRW